MTAAMLVACARTPPEEWLRATIAGLPVALEEHDGSALQEVLAGDFIGPGGLDRMVRAGWRRGRSCAIGTWTRGLGPSISTCTSTTRPCASPLR